LTDAAKIDGRRAKGDRTRARILDAAVLLASRQGLEGLTLGDVAKGAGVTKGAITVLFGNRLALQLATLDEALARFAAVAVTEPDAPALSRLADLFGAWFEFVGARTLPGGCFLHSVISEYRARPGPIQDRVRQRRGAWRATVLGLLAMARDRGELAAGADVEQLAFELLAFQAAADTADPHGDRAVFERARTSIAKALETVERT